MPERKCDGCKKQKQWGCEAKRFPIVDAEGNSILGPDGKPSYHWTDPAKIPEIFDGEQWFACPRQTLKEEPRLWSMLLMFYAMFKEGFLPQPGAIVDQSNAAVQLLTLMMGVNHECDSELTERSRRKNKGGLHGRMG